MTTTLTRPAVQVTPARDLPALPAALLELLDLFARDAVEAHALAARIGADPALSAKTLRLANSSFYGLARKVSSVGEAVAILGLRTMRTVVTMAALNSGIARPVCHGFDFPLFWRHAIAVAVAAKLIAVETGADPEAAFTAGLLHDMGRLVLASAHPVLYAQVLAQGGAHGQELARRESDVFGIDHSDAGALVAEHWRFPRPIVEAIGGHHVQGLGAGLNPLIQSVALADQLAHATQAGPELPSECQRAFDEVGLAPETMRQLAGEMTLQTHAIALALLN